jgi:hypothetical protein
MSLLTSSESLSALWNKQHALIFLSSVRRMYTSPQIHVTCKVKLGLELCQWGQSGPRDPKAGVEGYPSIISKSERVGGRKQKRYV